jgi:hypothetical protein
MLLGRRETQDPPNNGLLISGAMFRTRLGPHADKTPHARLVFRNQILNKVFPLDFEGAMFSQGAIPGWRMICVPNGTKNA